MAGSRPRFPRARRFVKRILPPAIIRYRGSAARRRIALTFDDGPVRPLTDSVLSALRHQGMTATFFVVGERAESEPEVLRAMVGQGCEVANHSYSHPFLNQTSTQTIDDEVRRTNRIIEEVTGSRSRHFRPPYGALSLRLWWYLRMRHHMSPVLWSAAAGVYEYDRNADEIVQDIRAAQLQPGDILLLHDAHPPTVAVLPEILALCRSRGLDVGTLSELLGSSR